MKVWRSIPPRSLPIETNTFSLSLSRSTRFSVRRTELELFFSSGTKCFFFSLSLPRQSQTNIDCLGYRVGDLLFVGEIPSAEKEEKSERAGYALTFGWELHQIKHFRFSTASTMDRCAVGEEQQLDRSIDRSTMWNIDTADLNGTQHNTRKRMSESQKISFMAAIDQSMIMIKSIYWSDLQHRFAKIFHENSDRQKLISVAEQRGVEVATDRCQ